MPDHVARLNGLLGKRYQFSRELARGGMATIFLAEDLRYSRAVAIKVMTREVALATDHSRFEQEIRIAARLNHPNIVPLHDSGEVDGLQFFVMPYVTGESLRSRLDREGQLAIEEAIRIARECAAALQYAHQQGVIHRDVKPGNILLSHDIVQLADFGIAAALESADKSRLTASGLTIGTPTYMSPEQAQGNAKLDGRSDIYSLGCVLFEMLVGEPPFSGSTARVVIARHLSETPPSVRVARPQAPDYVEGAVNKALAKAPADRFPSASTFANALAAPRAGTSATRSAFHHRRSVRAATGLLGILVALLFLWLAGFPPGPDRSAVGGQSIAVLPFETRSGAPDDQLLAAGLQNDITTHLSKLQGIRVIASGSVLDYGERPGDLRQVSSDLGVTTLLTGSVQRIGGNVRVNVRHIDGRTGVTLWSEIYDRTLTAENVFNIRSDIAQRIVREMALSMAPEKEVEPGHVPDFEAWESYQRGYEVFRTAKRTFDGRLLPQAIEYFGASIRRDSAFALAYARRSIAYWWAFAFGVLPGDSILEQVRADAALALAIDPDIVDGHLAMGNYYLYFEDSDRALGHYLSALDRDPNNAEALLQISAIHFVRADWEESYRFANAAAARDPRDAVTVGNAAYLAILLRKYPEARAAIGRAIVVASNREVALPFYWLRIQLELVSSGNLGAAAVWYRALVDSLAMDSMQVAGHFGGFGRGLSFMEATDSEKLSPLLRMPAIRQMLPWASGPTGQTVACVCYGTKAWLARIERPGGEERAYWDSAAVARAAEAEPWADVDAEAYWHAMQALLYARAGDRDEVAEPLARALQLAVRPDTRVFIREIEAKIAAELGDVETAIGHLQNLLQTPSFVTVHTLALEPAWDPIKGSPAFQALIDGN